MNRRWTIFIMLALLLWNTSVLAGDRSVKAKPPPKPSREDMKVIAAMDTLELMDLAESMEIVKDMDVLLEENRHAKKVD
jgi:hypothetical protein